MLRRDNGRLRAHRLFGIHPGSDGNPVSLPLREESDGVKRLVDLLPAFVRAATRGQAGVFVVDELDRSLHALLTRQLVEEFLQASSPVMRSQLLFTTHDVLLRDRDLLRLDEMWLIGRNGRGESSLTGVAEFREASRDRRLRSSYLEGRLAGIPGVLLGESLGLTDSDGADG